MAVPSYTEDLTDITLSEATTGFTALGGGGAGLSAAVDFAIQGTNSITKQVTGAGTRKGMIYNNGSGVTLGANDHVFAWVYTTCPGLIDTLTNGGMEVTIGTGTAAYNQYYVAGNDTFIKGGHFNWAVRYTTATPSPGAQTGTPGASPQYFGGQIQVTGTLRADNIAVDAIRIGTGAYLTAGELISAGDASDNPCTFSGFAAQNDNSSNQWGILTEIPGGYGLQGRFVIGQDNTQTATLARFSDTDVSISLWNTPHSLTDFTQIIIDHASTRCEWTGINISALGTNNPGKVVVNANNPTVIITSGLWTNLGTTVFRSNTSVDGLTWKICDSITLNGATLDNCIIDQNTAASAVLTDDLNDLAGNSFISDGTGHAVELSSIGAGSMTWNNTATGYAGVDGSTGNETLYVNVGAGSLTVNVSAGSTTPTIRTAGATVTVVSGAVTVLINVKNSEGTNLQNARVFLETAATAVSGESFEAAVTSITQTAGTATLTSTAAHNLEVNDKFVVRGAQPDGYNKIATALTVPTTTTLTYSVDSGLSSPATGTPLLSYVAIQGLTDVSGNISVNRTFGADQDFKGWARLKNTSSPFYKDADFSFTVDSGNGNTVNAVLQLDE